MSGGFEVYGATQKTTESNIDWDALNKYRVEKADCEKKKTLIGVISNVVDLGIQPLTDAEYDIDKEDLDLVSDNNDETIARLTERHKEQLAENFEGDEQYYKITKFDLAYDGKTKQYIVKKFVKQKPRQCVAFAIDFPSRQLDMGKFFGKAEGESVRPLRIWYGGQFYLRSTGKTVVQNLTPIKVKPSEKDKKKWVVDTKSLIYKLASATGVIEDGEDFEPTRLDELVGKAALFEATVTLKNGKGDNANKQYLTEKVKLVGALMDGQEAPTVENTHLIQFNGENDVEGLKELKAHIINTLEQAVNFEKSKIKTQLESLKSSGQADTEEQPADENINSEEAENDDESEQKATKGNKKTPKF